MTSLVDAIAKIDELIESLKNGSIKSSSSLSHSKPALPVAASKPTNQSKQDNATPEAPKQPAKQPKQPKQKPSSGGGAEPAPDSPEFFSKAQIVVARVTSAVPHPESEKLYITQVDIGNNQSRQIVAGLQKYIAQQDLEGSLVCVILNLKAAKLAGQVSEGMILAASAGEVVVPLRPSPEAQPGDAIYLEGSAGPADEYPKTLKSGPWGKILENLRVQGEKACFAGMPFVSGDGRYVVTKGMADGATIN